MPIWGWIIGAIVLVAILGIAWAVWSRRRTHRLRGEFGPEYDRALKEQGSRRSGESELESRRKRREAMEIRPLSAQSRERYAGRGGRRRSGSWTRRATLSVMPTS